MASLMDLLVSNGIAIACGISAQREVVGRSVSEFLDAGGPPFVSSKDICGALERASESVHWIELCSVSYLASHTNPFLEKYGLHHRRFREQVEIAIGGLAVSDIPASQKIGYAKSSIGSGRNFVVPPVSTIYFKNEEKVTNSFVRTARRRSLTK